MNFTMFISQMGQPNFDSEPIPNLCTEFVKFRTEPIPNRFRTDSEEFIYIPFRTVPNRTKL